MSFRNAKSARQIRPAKPVTSKKRHSSAENQAKRTSFNKMIPSRPSFGSGRSSFGRKNGSFGQGKKGRSSLINITRRVSGNWLHSRDDGDMVPAPKPLEVGDPVSIADGPFDGLAGYILEMEDDDKDIKINFGEDWDYVNVNHVRAIRLRRNSENGVPTAIQEDEELEEEEGEQLPQLVHDVSHEPLSAKRFFSNLAEPYSQIEDHFFYEEEYPVEDHCIHVQIGKSAFKGDAKALLFPFMTGDKIEEGARVKMSLTKQLWMEGKVLPPSEGEEAQNSWMLSLAKVRMMFESEESQRMFAAVGPDLHLFEEIGQGKLTKEQYFVCDDGLGNLPESPELRMFKGKVMRMGEQDPSTKKQKMILRFRSPLPPHAPIDIEAEVNPNAKHHLSCPTFRLIQTAAPVPKQLLIGQPVFMMGGAASGKTTFMRQFAHKVITETTESKAFDRVPLIVPASQLAECIERFDLGSDDDILGAYVSKAYGSREASLLFQMRDRKEVIVLLDSFDVGMMAPAAAEKLEAYVTCRLMSECCLCVTARRPVVQTVMHEMFLKFFLPVNVVSLNPAQKQKLIMARFEDIELDRWVPRNELINFTRQLIDNPDAQSFNALTGSPLYLNLLISDHINQYQMCLAKLKYEEDTLTDFEYNEVVENNGPLMLCSSERLGLTRWAADAEVQGRVLPRRYRANVFETLFAGMARFHRQRDGVPIRQAVRFLLFLGYVMHTRPSKQFRMFDEHFLNQSVFAVDEASDDEDSDEEEEEEEEEEPDDLTFEESEAPKMRLVWERHIRELVHSARFPMIAVESDGEKVLYRFCTIGFQEYLCSAFIVDQILTEEEASVGKRRRWIGDKIPELPMMKIFVDICQPDGEVSTLLGSPRYQAVVQMTLERLPKNTAATLANCFLTANSKGAVEIKKNLRKTMDNMTLFALVSCLRNKIILDLSGSDVTIEGIRGLHAAVERWGLPLPKINELDCSKVNLGLFMPPSLLDFDSCTNLQVLNLKDCKLTGQFSKFMFKMIFTLQYYNFKGNIFDVDPQTLVGVFVNEYTNIKDQTKLLLSGRKLIGTIPSFETCTKLVELDLSMNLLGGGMPSFDGCASLGSVFLSGNRLSGPLPSFETNTNLRRLDVSGNKLSGVVPSFTACLKLRRLELQRNFFEGPVPDVSTCSALKVLWCKDNSLSGTLPMWLIRKKAEGCSMSLSGNRGFELPHNLSDLGNDYTQLDLRDCSLVGKLPFFGDSLQLRELWLGGNQFAEEINNEMENSLVTLQKTLPACRWLDVTINSGDPELKKHALRKLRSTEDGEELFLNAKGARGGARRPGRLKKSRI